MAEVTVLPALAAIAFLVLIVGLVVRRWGPGVSKHLVRCPECKRMARVSVLFQESDFGSLKPVDIVGCSLFGGGPVTCDKDCLSAV